MKFIVDAQLSPTLAYFLTAKDESAIHVLDKQMMKASDSEIWGLALQENFIIITKTKTFKCVHQLVHNSQKSYGFD